MAKKGKRAVTEKQKMMYLGLAVVAIIVIVLLFIPKGRDGDGSGTSGEATVYESIFAADLILNKEMYEGKNVRIDDVLMRESNFAYITTRPGLGERLYITPEKPASADCINLDLSGKLMTDTERGWLFHVDKFDCN